MKSRGYREYKIPLPALLQSAERTNMWSLFLGTSIDFPVHQGILWNRFAYI